MSESINLPEWKAGNEFMPYHPSASHVDPDYRDGWNACYAAATTLMADLLALQMFVDSCIGEFPDIGDIDGFALQDIAESCGLLVKQTMTVPCGENCACAEVIDSDRTTECMRVQPALHRARVASAKAHAIRGEASPAHRVHDMSTTIIGKEPSK